MKKILHKKVDNAIDYAIQTNYEEFEVTERRMIRLRNAKHAVIFGMGKFFQDAYPYIEDFYPIKALVDNNERNWGKTQYGLTCESPNVLEKGTLVLVMVGHSEPIENQLNDMGMEYFCLNDIIKNMYTEHHDAEWFKRQRKDVVDTIDLFEDDFSREIYSKSICDRIAPHLEVNPWYKYQTENEYFNMEFWNLGIDGGYLDVGAYTGDTISQFCTVVKGRYGYIFGYEMDENIFQVLNENTKDLERCKVFRIGVSDSNVQNELTKLDDCSFPGKVDLIKMDIEGFEEKALNGACNLIRKDAPKLAICVYHRLEDLWRIPQILKEINPKYKIWLRHHSPCVWDTVCYATF